MQVFFFFFFIIIYKLSLSSNARVRVTFEYGGIKWCVCVARCIYFFPRVVGENKRRVMRGGGGADCE